MFTRCTKPRSACPRHQTSRHTARLYALASWEIGCIIGHPQGVSGGLALKRSCDETSQPCRCCLRQTPGCHIQGACACQASSVCIGSASGCRNQALSVEHEHQDANTQDTDKSVFWFPAEIFQFDRLWNLIGRTCSAAQHRFRRRTNGPKRPKNRFSRPMISEIDREAGQKGSKSTNQPVARTQTALVRTGAVVCLLPEWPAPSWCSQPGLVYPFHLYRAIVRCRAMRPDSHSGANTCHPGP